jgi:SAM-dependent methyltransferase
MSIRTRSKRWQRRLTLHETRSDDPQAEARPLALPGIHEQVKRVVDPLPRNTLLDVGAGEGAFSQWAAESGFDVTALDAVPEYFRAKDVQCLQCDLGQRWPVEDNQFDIVVSIEVIEHVENHYHFLRECCRVVKPDGYIVISTPNCHSLQSRLNYLLTGFDDCAPRPIDHERPDMYMAHIHPLPFPTMELGLRACGFEVQQMTYNRRRRISTLLLPLLYPWAWWRTYRQLILREHKPKLRERNRQLLKLMLSPAMLTGRVAIYTCRHQSVDSDAEAALSASDGLWAA